MFPDTDTIIAPATAVGVGAISIIRLSGPDSFEYLSKCFSKVSGSGVIRSHYLSYGSFVDDTGHVLDRVMAVYMRGPASFTTEDVVEVHCHANPYVVKAIINCFTTMGARLAEPGEFTYRAFMHGRIDLSEAEAIAELIDAGSETSARIALQHLEGSISDMASHLHERLFEMLALVEAYLDFPEDEVNNIHLNHLNDSTNIILDCIDNLISTFRTGRVLREGLSILILGRPNVGKSSLLNYLLGRDRAIVTEIPGTTRDFIEEHITLGHLPVKLVDTAGLRESSDVIEQSGIKRAKDRIKEVDLVLYVVDGSDPSSLDLEIEDLELGGTPYQVVYNKADKFDYSALRFDSDVLCVSAVSGFGIDELKKRIEATFSFPDNADSSVVTEQRHYDIFVQVKNEVLLFKDGLDSQVPGEFLACHIREAMSQLGRITGETVPDDILNHIFSKFCVGK